MRILGEYSEPTVVGGEDVGTVVIGSEIVAQQSGGGESGGGSQSGVGESVGGESVGPQASETPIDVAATPEQAASVTPVGPVSPTSALPLVNANFQPAVAITQLIETTGTTVGTVHHFAGNFAINGSAIATGQLLPIAQYGTLFAAVGTAFGGDGTTNFALPELTGTVSVGAGQGPGLTNHAKGEVFGSGNLELVTTQLPVKFGGNAQPFTNLQPSATTGYYIVVNGVFPSPYAMVEGGGSAPDQGIGPMSIIGTVWEFAGTTLPINALPCDGRLIAISENETLFQLIGTTFGGDGQETFALPDLRGRTIMHQGTMPGGSTVYQIGQTVGAESGILTTANMPVTMGEAGAAFDNHGPALVLNYLIALQGIYPSRSSAVGLPGNDESFGDADQPFLGEIIAFAGNFAPKGYALANGQLLPINQNQALYSILGTNYGGNQSTNFALPDLRGRSIIGGGGTSFATPGNLFGSETLTLGINDIPALNYSGTAAGETLHGSNYGDAINGLAGNDILYGNGGDDTLNGGDGNDTLDGGLGADTASYATASAAVTVNLNLATQQNTGGAGFDTLVSIERLTGSAFNDTLTGFSSLDNLLSGGAGNDIITGGTASDTLAGGAGDDTLYGAAGIDTVSYAASAGAVTVRLALNSGSGEGTDYLQDIENVIGSNFDDMLVGTSGANILDGGAGNDQLSGEGGADRLIGGTGDDSFFVYTAGTTIVENNAGGTDTIWTGLAAFTIASNVEFLRYDGFGSFVGTGDGAANNIVGGPGNDTLYGNAGNDTLYFQAGGNDSGYGGNDNDVFYYGGALTAADYNDGGSGTDTLVLQGNYVTTLGATALIGIEGLSLQSGSVTTWGMSGGSYDYNVTSVDANVGAGQQLRVNGQSLLVGEDLTFNGSAESDGKFLIFGGFGTDTLTGGAGNDIFFFEAGRLGAGDRVVGGAGADSLVISGGPSGSPSPIPITIFASSFSGIESLSFNGRFASNPAATPSYAVVLQDGNIAAGATLIVNASSLVAGQTITFNGSAVSTGAMIIYGGESNDTLQGGANADTLYGQTGADQLRGNGGADLFAYRSTTDSKLTGFDTILDFTAGSDRIDLTRIDANSASGTDDAFSFIGSAAFGNVAGQLRATYDAASTTWTIQGDTNGDGVGDLHILAVSPTLTVADFLL